MQVLGGSERVGGAPGMRPNFNNIVYYQYISEVLIWKSGPESGPSCHLLHSFFER